MIVMAGVWICMILGSHTYSVNAVIVRFRCVVAVSISSPLQTSGISFISYASMVVEYLVPSYGRQSTMWYHKVSSLLYLPNPSRTLLGPT